MAGFLYYLKEKLSQKLGYSSLWYRKSLVVREQGVSEYGCQMQYWMAGIGSLISLCKQIDALKILKVKSNRFQLHYVRFGKEHTFLLFSDR